MRDRIFQHMGSVLGGMIHNLNTPLMWVMGRAQLIQARNETLESLQGKSEDDFLKIKDKNAKDIDSILQGAEKIDQTLKAVGYKVQMAGEGFGGLEVKEFLEYEMDYLLADMRFKHETKLEFNIENARTQYVKVDYNALSWMVITAINAMIESSERSRTIKVELNNGLIVLSCETATFNDETRGNVQEAMDAMKETGTVHLDESAGIIFSIGFKA